jgi:phosphocarrier protein HPr
MIVKKDIVVKNKTGLHARPASVFVQMANKFQSRITIVKEDNEVDGKSIMGILMLAAERGATITIIADGEDAEQAIGELSELLSNNIEAKTPKYDQT